MVPLQGSYPSTFIPPPRLPFVKSDKAYRDGRPLSESGGALHFTALLLRLRYFPQQKKKKDFHLLGISKLEVS